MVGRIKKEVKKYLENTFSIKISKGLRPKFIDGKGSNNIIVEFAGPSGIGKTTLRNYYIKNHQIKINRELIRDFDLEEYASVFKLRIKEVNDVYEQILKSMMTHIHKKYPSGIEQMKRATFYYNVFIRDYILTTSLDNKIAFLDEPLYHHAKDSYLEIIKRNPKSEEFIKQRLFIICTASPERNLKNLRERERLGGNLIIEYEDLDESEFIKKIQTNLNEVIRRAEELRRLGGKVLELNMEDDLMVNTNKIDEYIIQYFPESTNF